MFRSREPPSRRTKLIILASVAAFAVILLIVLLAVLIRPKHPVLDTNDRIECPGFRDEKDCKTHGCEYARVKTGPACFMKKDKFGYKVKSSSNVPSSQSKNAFLTSLSSATPYGPSIPLVKFEVIYITNEIVRIKISDANNQRYEVPVQNEFPLLNEKNPIDMKKLAYEVEFEQSVDERFYFQIRRAGDNTSLWDTRIGGLLLADKYLQISSYLPSKNVYGLGEHVHPSLRHDLEYKTWPMFARDRFPEGVCSV